MVEVVAWLRLRDWGVVVVDEGKPVKLDGCDRLG